MKELVRRTAVISCTAIGILAFGIALYSARWILLIAAVAVGSGVLLAPPLQALNRKLRISRGVGAAFVLLVVVALVGAAGILIFQVLSDSLGPLASKFPETINSARDRLSDYLDRIPILRTSLRRLDWGAALQQGFDALFKGVSVGIGILGLLIYLLATSLYLAADPQRYLDGALSLLPRTQHTRARTILSRSAETLRSWFFAQLIAMTGVGACAAIGLLIIGLDYWLPLGILTGILDIVPFLGPMAATACAVIVTLGVDPSKVPWVLASFVIVEQIEAKVIIPLVMKGRIKLPPFQLLTFMLILGNWFGVLGVLLAPPLLAISRTLLLDIYVPAINARPALPRPRSGSRAA